MSYIIPCEHQQEAAPAGFLTYPGYAAPSQSISSNGIKRHAFLYQIDKGELQQRVLYRTFTEFPSESDNKVTQNDFNNQIELGVHAGMHS